MYACPSWDRVLFAPGSLLLAKPPHCLTTARQEDEEAHRKEEEEARALEARLAELQAKQEATKREQEK